MECPRLRSVLLIRPKLPVKHQIVMTKALGGEHSNRYYEACSSVPTSTPPSSLSVSEEASLSLRRLVSSLQNFFDAIFVISSALSLAYFWAQHRRACSHGDPVTLPGVENLWWRSSSAC